MQQYYAFGLVIESEFDLPQVEISKATHSDVVIKSMPNIERDFISDFSIEKQAIRFSIKDIGNFKITNGNTIEVYPLSDDYSKLPIFLLGSCMGALLHQRGEMILHGSCVSKGEQTILITGDSGSGKSTLASVFLSHGWKLLTDDVAVIKNPENAALVQPSYPSQKIWGDSPEFNSNNNEIHSVYKRDGHSKFGINVKDSFVSEPKTLTTILKLIASDNPSYIEPINGFTKIDQLMKNTYRYYMLNRDELETHFQKCVTMSLKVPMFLVNRRLGEDNREKLYELVMQRK